MRRTETGGSSRRPLRRSGSAGPPAGADVLVRINGQPAMPCNNECTNFSELHFAPVPTYSFCGNVVFLHRWDLVIASIWDTVRLLLCWRPPRTAARHSTLPSAPYLARLLLPGLHPSPLPPSSCQIPLVTLRGLLAVLKWKQLTRSPPFRGVAQTAVVVIPLICSALPAAAASVR